MGNTTSQMTVAALLFALTATGISLAGEIAFPVKVSENKRYFVDQKGTPVFWLGTTQWQLFREYKREDARTILEKSHEKGFVFAQVMLMGVGDGTKANVYGEKPWIDNNPLTPNEAYFKNVDAIVDMARENDLAISMTVYHQRYRKCITVANARAWGKWIGQRYKNAPNIVWSSTPETKPEFIPVLRELVAGLRDGDGGSHPVTFKPDPAPHPAGFLHDEPWLDFSAMQTWKWVEQIYPMVTNEYNLQPTKPVVMAEGAYEHGSEYGFDVTPLWIRRQAWYSYVAGAHHTYGHNDSWRVLPTWKQALDAPGATQLGVLKKIFTAQGVVVSDARPEHLRKRRRHERTDIELGRPPQGRSLGHGIPGRQGILLNPHGQTGRRQGEGILGRSEDRRCKGDRRPANQGRRGVYDTGGMGGRGAGAGGLDWPSALIAKHSSSTTRPPIRCSWMIRSAFSGVTFRYHAPSGYTTQIGPSMQMRRHWHLVR